MGETSTPTYTSGINLAMQPYYDKVYKNSKTYDFSKPQKLSYDASKTAINNVVPQATVKVEDVIKNKSNTSEAKSDKTLADLVAAITAMQGGNQQAKQLPDIISQASNNGKNTVWANTGNGFKDTLANIGQFLGFTKNIENTIPVALGPNFAQTHAGLINSDSFNNATVDERATVFNNLASLYPDTTYGAGPNY